MKKTYEGNIYLTQGGKRSEQPENRYMLYVHVYRQAFQVGYPPAERFGFIIRYLSR